MHATDFLGGQPILEGIAAIRSRVSRALEGGMVAIVGSAALPQKCARAARSAGGKIACFIEYDARFWGRNIEGIPVVSPVEALALAGQDALVIVGIWSPHHRYAETKRWLEAFGFSSVLPVPALFWVLADRIGPHYQLAPPEKLTEGLAAIRRVHDVLGDARSQQQFLSHLTWRLTLDPSHIVVPDRHRVYFDPELFRITNRCVIADCGAFDGDSLRSCLYWTGGVFGRFHAFEPDPISFGKLSGYVGRLQDEVSARINLVQAGVADKPGVIRIAGTGMPGSQQSQGVGAVDVSCLMLDEAFASGRVDYIKLDIEGAEWEALAGAARIIARDRPVIATAIYHKPDDIFALPAAIIAQTEDYRYFMRTHDDDGIDFVFYAVPKERLGAGAIVGGRL